MPQQQARTANCILPSSKSVKSHMEPKADRQTHWAANRACWSSVSDKIRQIVRCYGNDLVKRDGFCALFDASVCFERNRGQGTSALSPIVIQFVSKGCDVGEPLSVEIGDDRKIRARLGAPSPDFPYVHGERIKFLGMAIGLDEFEEADAEKLIRRYIDYGLHHAGLTTEPA